MLKELPINRNQSFDSVYAILLLLQYRESIKKYEKLISELLYTYWIIFLSIGIREEKQPGGEGTYITYDYDVMDRITGITYPNNKTVNYAYNKLGEITGMPGYLAEAPVYDKGLLKQTRALNGVETNYTYDPNGRLSSLSYEHEGTEVKSYAFTYDGVNNIIKKNEDTFTYDAENRLVAAYLKGNFAVPVEDENQPVGVSHDDLFGTNQLSFALEEVLEDANVIELDYAAGSIGVDLGGVYKVTRIVLKPENPANRVTPDAIRVFVSQTNYPDDYTEVKGFQAGYVEKDGETVLEIVLNSPMDAKFIKVHSEYNDREMFDFLPRDKAEFKNSIDKIIKVYYYVDSRTEEYEYSDLGDRTKETVTLKATKDKNYRYYPGSNRLMTDGRWAYVFDANGNVVGKGDMVLVDGTAVKVKDVQEGYWAGVVSSTSDVELTSENGGANWVYQFDLQNRLMKILKNNGTVANYTYNHKGYRVMKEKWVAEKEGFETTYYVFSPNGKVLYEQKVDAEPAATDDYKQYVYLFNKHFAREDGKVDLGGVVEETGRFYLHVDHLWSITTVTDEDGSIIWQNDFRPFGQLVDEKNTFDGSYSYTGHSFDEDANLVYMNARWYDPDTGRFVSTDPAKDGINWYAYCSNNPLTFVDPSGLSDSPPSIVQPWEPAPRSESWDYQWGYNPNMVPDLTPPDPSTEPEAYARFLYENMLFSFRKNKINDDLYGKYIDAGKKGNIRDVINLLYNIIQEFRKVDPVDVALLYNVSYFFSDAYVEGMRSAHPNIDRDSAEYKFGFITAFLNPKMGFEGFLEQHMAEEAAYNAWRGSTYLTLQAAGALTYRDPPALKDAVVTPPNQKVGTDEKIHGNSLKSTKTNYGYALKDKTTGKTLKYGETIHPNTRYSKSFLNKNNAEMVIEIQGAKIDIHNWQHQQILEFIGVFGTRPTMNKSNW